MQMDQKEREKEEISYEAIYLSILLFITRQLPKNIILKMNLFG
jgi:hypothetical protein